MLLFLILILIILYIRRIYGKKIETNPVFFVPFIFLIQFGIPILIYGFYNNIYYSQEGLAILSLFPIFYIMGNSLLLFNLKKYPKIKPIILNYLPVRNLLILSIFVSIFNIIYTLKATLEFAKLDISIDTIFLAAGVNSAARYSTDEGRVAQGLVFYLSIFHYLSAIIAGMAHVLYPKKRIIKILVIASLLTGIIASSLEGAKMIFLIVLIIFTSSSILTRVLNSDERKSWFKIKNIGGIIILILLLVVIFFSIQALRYFDNNTQAEIDYAAIGDIILVSAVGHLSAFSVWINKVSIENINPVPFGKYTLSGFVSIFGIERLPGLYGNDDVYVLNSYTNIYTVYRAIIQEVTYFSYLLFFFLGYISQFVYLSLINKFSISKLTFMIAIYSFFIWGHIASIFNYNTIVLAFVLFLIFGKLFFRKNSSF